jgi:hypothetical protein
VAILTTVTLATTNNALPDDGVTALKHVTTHNALPDDGVTALKHVRAILM